MAWFAAHYDGSLPARECMVSPALALKPSRMACEAPSDEVAAAGPAAACGVRADTGVASVIADDFSIEDLLDLHVLEDCAELGDDAAREPVHGTAEGKDKLSNESHVSASVVSYESMTLPAPHQMADLSLPDHDAEDLEWLSCIMDDSLSEPPTLPKMDAAALVAAARLPLDGATARSSHTQTICALSTEALVRVKAKRSKRPRACVSPLSGGALMPEFATSSYCTSSVASGSPRLLLPAPGSSSLLPSSSQFFLHGDSTGPEKKNSKHGEHGSKKGGKPKKRGSKLMKHHPRRAQFAGGAVTSGYSLSSQQGGWRCSHCGVNKTPQWREGPGGAKTLCNACGMRYKTGRLFPEYRPACSPTFVSTIHSNFHRKVLAMRRQKEDANGPCPLPLPLPPVRPAAIPALGPAAVSF